MWYSTKTSNNHDYMISKYNSKLLILQIYPITEQASASSYSSAPSTPVSSPPPLAPSSWLANHNNPHSPHYTQAVQVNNGAPPQAMHMVSQTLSSHLRTSLRMLCYFSPFRLWNLFDTLPSWFCYVFAFPPVKQNQEHCQNHLHCMYMKHSSYEYDEW